MLPSPTMCSSVVIPNLYKIEKLCSSEHVTVVPAGVRQELLDLAKAIQCDHLESRWRQDTAEQGTSQSQRVAMAFWLLHAPRWFPDLHNKTYFIPPLDPDSNQNGGDTTAGQKYGLIVVRVKLVGFRMDDVQDVTDKLADAVAEAVKELNAADRLLKHMTSDLQGVKVTKVIALPCVMSGQLEQALRDAQNVNEIFKKTRDAAGRSPQVYRHHFCFMEDEMDEAIDALVEVARAAGGQLYLLIDEAGPPKLFPKFCQQLVSRVPTVHLWATALEHGLRPACLTEVRLTIPYRCPWAVLQEISASRAFSDGHVYQYDQNVVATEKDGTRMKYVKHKNQRGHTGHYPLECVVRRFDPDDVIRDVALAISNRVTVADYTMVAGLERLVVVGMGAEGFCSYSDMLAMSRSSGHLLWIEKAKAEKMKRNE
nr:hypothetical protein BaRGS_008379 [Batillaria attramentaria]